MNIQEAFLKSHEFGKQEVEITREDIPVVQDLIILHNNLYYKQDNPIISDRDYDKLFMITIEAEEKFNITNKITDKVGF